MKHIFCRLVPLLLPACMVDTPVVESEETRLGEGLGAWCESLCDKANACESSDDLEECPSSCVGYFTETYAGKSDVCTEAALRLMDCFEDASCSELRDNGFCDEPQEAALCMASVGLVSCDAGSDSIGSSGGSAGMAGSAGSAPTTSSCDIGLSECSDFKEYMLACTGTGAMSVCECSIDGYVHGRFAMNGTTCPQSLEAKQICGWPMTQGFGEPELPPLVTCRGGSGSGSAGGGPVAECDTSFTECSDGHEYGVSCSGSAGAVECRCLIDEQIVHSSTSGTGLCPFIHAGPAAANYACGFRIAPPAIE